MTRPSLGEQLRQAFPLPDADECIAATLARLERAQADRAAFNAEAGQVPTPFALPINSDGAA